jgi:hypothetical protein
MERKIPVNLLLAVPSPSPTGRPVGLDAVESPKFWLVVLGLIAFFAVVRAVNKLLGWGPRGDQ